jgi:hypothetical protein
LANEKVVVEAAMARKISLGEAEWRLRKKFGSGNEQGQYQLIYNYLDEIAGVLDGKKETNEQHSHFVKFVQDLGLSSEFE